MQNLTPAAPPIPLLQVYSKKARTCAPFSQPAPYRKNHFYSNSGKSPVALVRDKFGAIWCPTRSGDDLTEPCLGEDCDGDFQLIAHNGRSAALGDSDRDLLKVLISERFEFKMRQLLKNHLTEIQDEFLAAMGEIDAA